MFKWISNIGPGTLIAAAFIGPGTVTVCVAAGVTHGFDLLWAMVFSIIATVVLQEMSARIGLVTNKGLSEIIRTEIKQPIFKIFSILLILSAIVLGNAAYEAGNLSGAVMGLNAIGLSLPNLGFNPFSLLVGALAFVILYIGNYKLIERLLIAIVILMSISFLFAAILTKPSLGEIIEGMFIPTMPRKSTLTIMGIVGTTVVPYNLFLHASLVKEKWTGSTHLSAVRKDLFISIFLGGFISLMIIIAAASLNGKGLSITSALDMAQSLEPLLGKSARYMIGIGLFAAGLTSAITAPLAAAYVCTELLDWDRDLKSRAFRGVWIFILLIGILFSSIGWSPIVIIRYAQFTNGMLLPIIAGFLLWIVNKRSVLKNHRNNTYQNILGLFILVVTIALGVKSIWAVLGMI
ncbi:MAG: manganese transport protein [Saprospiraceae bacterium]|jgi:manganese transport protein|tara:strand:+ start:2263 stop:3480 length:1218 start_codon:yes stop_codon:yes gene_type:complete